MHAELDGEDEEYVKIYVTDNFGTEHDLTFEKVSGEIVYHDQDGYPDEPEDRTVDENAYIDQARRRARYHVYQETEYNPFPVESNLPGIERTKRAIEALDLTEFESFFEDAYDQVLSKHPSVDPPIKRPASVPNDGYILYLVDVYLDENDEIEAVSDIHLQYHDADGEKTRDWNTNPFPDRDPDARLQLFGKYVPSMEVFQEFLVYHLRCQVRDVYIGSGLEPPEEYRVLGRGIDQLTSRYSQDDITVYEPYDREEADIPGYDLEFDYGFGELGKQSVINAKRTGSGSEGSVRGVDPELFDPSRDSKNGLLESVASLFGSRDTDEDDE